VPKTFASANQIPGSNRPQQYQRAVQSSPGALNSPAQMHSNTLHTEQLPTSHVPLDDALTHIETNISPWENPLEWVAADSEHVNSVVDEIAELTKRREINQAKFADQFIVYPVSCLCLNALDT
jgi:hypothetical protein